MSDNKQLTPEEELQEFVKKMRTHGSSFGRRIVLVFVLLFALSSVGDFASVFNITNAEAPLIPSSFYYMFGPISFFVFIVFLILISIRQVNQYERGVKFQLGKYKTITEPGWRLVFPVIQSMTKVDIRTKVVDVPLQETITKDNVSARINAVLFYRVTDVKLAIIDVERYYDAVSQLAQTTMRNVAGEMTLDELLSNREAAADRIRTIVDKASDPWGILVESVELKDIILPEDMVRTIGKQAEAERERRAVIINSEGEVVAAENLRKAADILASSSGALHLRTLNSINDISSDKSNTIVFALPLEVLKAFEHWGKGGK